MIRSICFQLNWHCNRLNNGIKLKIKKKRMISSLIYSDISSYTNKHSHITVSVCVCKFYYLFFPPYPLYSQKKMIPNSKNSLVVALKMMIKYVREKAKKWLWIFSADALNHLNHIQWYRTQFISQWKLREMNLKFDHR